MSDKMKNILLSLLTLVLLAAFALAVPSPELTKDAQDAYMDQGPASVDDEYAFLFE